ncbi:DegT/DnrJ/EryC1/StrS aminotransferase family protein [Bacillus sp. MMSF_3353]|uniref:DegT/DnrJ/EryC1/StrS family aminotransferase n=1 Tax=Bacillus sp. MMSF_3353 TaxID=3047081 RepID=UPI00273FA489|nr:DegT/DnrJ/EryC1/StrS family aminotransferase [Bacillus sp. MMSF_3353]
MNKLAISGGEAVVSLPYNKVWPPINHEEIEACIRLIARRELSYYGREGEVKDLEDKFTEYHQVKYAIATGTGTSSLHSAFFAVGVGPGDEVIVPTYTFLATVTPIFQCYAKPVLCDCEPDTGNIDPEKIKLLITDKTKAIVLTHMWGHPCDMDKILDICKEHKIFLIEDCSHAHGATYNGKKVGSIGDVGCFSLQTNKIISAGTGGILITNNQEIYERATLLGHFRVRSQQCVESEKYAKYAKTGFGMNYRMHPLGAAMASRQMDDLDRRIEERNKNLNYLTDLLKEIPGINPPITRENVTRGAYYGYKPHYKSEELNNLPLEAYVAALQAEGVDVHLPGSKPLHLSPIFQEGGAKDLYSFNGNTYYDMNINYKRGDFPVAEKFQGTSLSMPTFTGEPDLLIEQYASAFRKIANNVEEVASWWEKKSKVEARV